MTKKLLIATRNKGKFVEIKPYLADLGIELLTMDDVKDLSSDYEVEEPGMTFEGNAIIKAMTIGNMTGLLTMSEDAGLMVDALDGRPGVYSARYAPGTDEDRYMKLLGELKDVPEEKRTAQFKAVFAIYDPETAKIRTCEGVYNGRILTEPRGNNGFGYDPVFFCEEHGKTNAEMSTEEKNMVSHRGQGLKKAKEILLNEFL